MTVKRRSARRTHLSRMLYLYRHSIEKTQAEVGAEMGLTTAQVTRIESGGDLSAAHLLKLADWLLRNPDAHEEADGEDATQGMGGLLPQADPGVADSETVQRRITDGAGPTG